MRHLDHLLETLENPPFDKVARLCVDVSATLTGARVLALGATTLAGNTRQESPKKPLEAIEIRSPEELEARVRWVLSTTQQRRLSTPVVEETYAAAPLGYSGPPEALEAELDARLDAAKSLLDPQVITHVAASLIPEASGSPAACFVHAHFQGVLISPHIIEVKLFDSDLRGAGDARWPAAKGWAQRAARRHGCTIPPEG